MDIKNSLLNRGKKERTLLEVSNEYHLILKIMPKKHKKKNKSVEDSIMENLSPWDLLALVEEELEDSDLYIWDKVQLITDTKWDKVYTIYSFTTYADWRINFTLWNWADYEMYEPWQIKKYIPVQSIWFNNTTDDKTNK